MSEQADAFDPGLDCVQQLCSMTLDTLRAQRVLLWRHVSSSRLVSPIAGALAGDPSYSLSNLAWRWSERSVEDLPPFERCLQTRESVLATSAELQHEIPAFARELVAESVW